MMLFFFFLSVRRHPSSTRTDTPFPYPTLCRAGAIAHASKSGVCHFTSVDDAACIDDVRYLLSYLPSNNLEEAPVVTSDDDATRLCPDLRDRSEEHTSELQSLMRISYAVFCLKKKNTIQHLQAKDQISTHS